ncbi:MAG: 50S ribosomal protein L23, partial [Clostridia bacterium]|nr:50S ribosomal protein L23 [Clostridia bacterium]
IEDLFNVKVDKVNTIKIRGKRRRQGRYEGYTPERKKAVVTLKPGYKLEIIEGV